MKAAAGVEAASEKRRLAEANALLEAADASSRRLEELLKEARAAGGSLEQCRFCRDRVIPEMAALRDAADKLEQITSSDLWPFPVYEELVMGLRR